MPSLAGSGPDLGGPCGLAFAVWTSVLEEGPGRRRPEQIDLVVHDLERVHERAGRSWVLGTEEGWGCGRRREDVLVPGEEASCLTMM